MADPAESEKFTTVKQDEIKSLIQNAITTQAKLFVWTPGQKYRLFTRVVNLIESGEQIYIAVKSEKDELEFEGNLKSEEMKDCLFNLALPTDILFFKGELRKSDRGFLNFKITFPMYKVQRRHSFRLPVHKINMTAQFTAPKTGVSCQGRVIDLSDGGMAFSLEDGNQVGLFEAGSHVPEILFVLGTRTFRCEGEIRYCKEMALSKTKRVIKFGLMFKNLTKDEKEIINGWVLEECSNLFGRI